MDELRKLFKEENARLKGEGKGQILLGGVITLAVFAVIQMVAVYVLARFEVPMFRLWSWLVPLAFTGICFAVAFAKGRGGSNLLLPGGSGKRGSVRGHAGLYMLSSGNVSSMARIILGGQLLIVQGLESLSIEHELDPSSMKLLVSTLERAEEGMDLPEAQSQLGYGLLRQKVYLKQIPGPANMPRILLSEKGATLLRSIRGPGVAAN